MVKVKRTVSDKKYFRVVFREKSLFTKSLRKRQKGKQIAESILNKRRKIPLEAEVIMGKMKGSGHWRIYAILIDKKVKDPQRAKQIAKDIFSVIDSNKSFLVLKRSRKRRVGAQKYTFIDPNSKKCKETIGEGEIEILRLLFRPTVKGEQVWLTKEGKKTTSRRGKSVEVFSIRKIGEMQKQRRFINFKRGWLVKNSPVPFERGDEFKPSLSDDKINVAWNKALAIERAQCPRCEQQRAEARSKYTIPRLLELGLIGEYFQTGKYYITQFGREVTAVNLDHYSKYPSPSNQQWCISTKEISQIAKTPLYISGEPQIIDSVKRRKK